ncbi:MAG: hypothetical protein JWQ19_2968 [Subtercola sp.]|nr:hypothetical protein [Subtercola sp.]
MSTDDLRALERIVALYGHIVDAQEWSRLGELFTDDVVMVPWQEDLLSTTSLGELIERWSAPEFPHPSGHHATNVLIDPQDDETAQITWKGIAVHHDGRCRSLLYEEHVRRTDDGWRAFWRRVTLQSTSVDPLLAQPSPA